jgi:hypothetical protein
MPPLLRSALALAAAVLAAVHGAARAQTDDLERLAPGTSFLSGSLADAIRQARQQKRLLIVYSYVPGSPEAAWMDAVTWRNPTLAAYIRWHCLAFKQASSTTGVSIVKDGCPVWTECCVDNGRAADMKLLPGTLTAGATLPAIPNVCPGPIFVLFQADFALERIKATDPVWWTMHEHRNPPPEAPPMPPPFYRLDDDRGPAVEDPPLDDPSFSVWDRLASARAAMNVGNLHGATGLYTWLWERAHRVDPAFGPARRTVIVAEIADLAARRPGARERFAQIRDAHGVRLLWAEYDELLEWASLNGVVGDDGLSIEWLDLFSNDVYEASMMPRADRIACRAVGGRSRFTDPFELGRDPVDRVSRIERLASGGRPRLVPAEDWARLRTFLRDYLLEEGCRLHAACLKAGREADARAIADIVLRSDSGPLARRALVTTALVAGVPSAMHAAILGDADADLLARLSSALALKDRAR